MALLDNSQDIKSWVPGEQILALALFAGLVYYILSPRKTIYDEFPKVSDNVIRSIFWPTHIQKLVWKGYQNVRILCSILVFYVSWILDHETHEPTLYGTLVGERIFNSPP